MDAAKLEETKSAQAYALRRLGEYMVQYAATNNRTELDNMTFWHNQAWMLSQEIAAAQA